MHTTASDGWPTPEELVEHAARRAKLDVIAVTDHDTIDGALRAQDHAAKRAKFHVIVGEEVSSRDGHIVALFLERRVRPGMSAAATLDAIHDQGGLAIAVHPFSMLTRSIGFRTFDGIMHNPSAEIYFDAVETFNPSVAGRTCAAKINRLNQERFHLPEVGCSDSHHLEGIGTGYTTFPGKTAQDVRKALLASQTRAGGEYWDFVTHRRIAQLKFRRIGRNWARAGRSAVRAVSGG